jgi:hypothetical protein
MMNITDISQSMEGVEVTRKATKPRLRQATSSQNFGRASHGTSHKQSDKHSGCETAISLIVCIVVKSNPGDACCMPQRAHP